MDITKEIKEWIGCCCDVWKRWFLDKEDGAHDFYEVEQALLKALVLSPLGLINFGVDDLKGLCNVIMVRYKKNINDLRSECKVQKKGNVFCKSQQVKIGINEVFKVRSIDFMGTMLDGKPYAEVKISNENFILEPIDNLIFDLKEVPAKA